MKDGKSGRVSAINVTGIAQYVRNKYIRLATPCTIYPDGKCFYQIANREITEEELNELLPLPNILPTA